MHGNFEAYEAVLDALNKEGAVKNFCVGDIVGYGADPAACIEATIKSGAVAVCGNHDWAAVGLTSLEHFNHYAKEAAIWTASNLREKDREYLKSLKLTYVDDDITLVHGALMHPELFEYVIDPRTAHRMMSLMETKIAFIGHSHVPGIFRSEKDKVEYTQAPEVLIEDGKKYLVNVGSVGQPRDGDKRASYCIWDKDKRLLRIKRAEYDIETAQKKILDAGLPEILSERLSEGR